MKTTAIIPARAGSRRVPGKNTRLLAGLPLITWSIRSALDAGCFHRVIVSTEDREIAELGRAEGAEVPWMRPVALASDDITAVEVVCHVLSQLESEHDRPDSLMLLQPTSPFRTAGSIQRALALHLDNAGESVVSVSRAVTHPYWCKKVGDDGRLEPFLADVPISQSQNLPPAYQLNGLIYLASADQLARVRGFYSDATRALIIDDPEEAIDIDTSLDWRLAETVAQKRRPAGSEGA